MFSTSISSPSTTPPRSLPSTPLRILQVVPSYFPAVRYGGPIRSVHALSAALVHRGHAVTVYTTNMDGNQNLRVPLGKPVDIDGVEVNYFPIPALRRLCWCPAMGTRLRETVASFDIVHLQSIYLWPTAAAARAAHKAGVPYVMSPRGMLVRDIIRRKSRWTKTAWINLVERVSLARAAGLHVTARIEGEEVQALGLRTPELFCIPNGVEWPDEHVRLEAGPFANIPRPYALFLSRISWKKGLDRLISAWKAIPDLQLVIAGNDEEDYLPTLRQLARTHGVSDRVHFVGSAADDHKWALYENAELFVLPSYSENFGNVVAEAMAMSCPVVVTPEVGIASLVQESGAGIVADGTPAALASAISDLYRDKSKRSAMGRAGGQVARNVLSWDGVAAQMEAAYRSALRSAGKTALDNAPWRRRSVIQ